ncbi:pre-mRNA-splicing factor 38B-like isoform X2 [Xiphophorus hellerii]|nr:pre-mRNA-splicing factor 38B-like isoform X2 [Xiphophorus hellerii]XP_032419818.1 pre-mRNA-splicing factor 38B-like isoform X2 [Xiphophorus hellerii]
MMTAMRQLKKCPQIQLQLLETTDKSVEPMTIEETVQEKERAKESLIRKRRSMMTAMRQLTKCPQIQLQLLETTDKSVEPMTIEETPQEKEGAKESLIRKRRSMMAAKEKEHDDSHETTEEVPSNSTAAPGNNRQKRGAHDNRRDRSGEGKGKGKSHKKEKEHDDSHETTDEVPSNSTAAPGNNRQKRGAHDNRRDPSGEGRGKGKSHKKEKEHDDSHETTEEVPSNSTATPGNNRQKRGAHDNRRDRSGEGKGKGKSHKKEKEHDDSHETTDEVPSNSTAAPGNNRQKRGAHDNRRDPSGEGKGKGKSPKTTAASASYGIFQLSDGYFCDSGNNLSRNLCQKSCTDFTNDDITDDIECFLKAFFDGYLRRPRSHHCDDEAGTSLQDCS